MLQTIAPYRAALVVCVACLCTWYGLAGLCAHAGIPVVLGSALYLQALHGGKANNDQIDAQNIAGLLRGGLWPHAPVYPAALHANPAGQKYLARLEKKHGQGKALTVLATGRARDEPADGALQ